TSLHILIASVAYSLFTAACGVGILLAIQEYQLKHHRLKQLLRVPPLQVLERLMFEFIWAAFVLLSITIATGFYFIEDMFAQHLVHKTVFTIASWFVFAGLLGGRLYLGWRGQLAVKLTLSGFVLLMFGYFGTQIAVEIINK
ncbi:MAG: cytochrome c biogenesis protein CcsA, partial [Pseudomonadota bacterium]|nr:cytochrome c biogenesis protein CcsA [Pseudomonadota bacterium]